jgi:hypothetical protein
MLQVKENGKNLFEQQLTEQNFPFKHLTTVTLKVIYSNYFKD